MNLELRWDVRLGKKHTRDISPDGVELTGLDKLTRKRVWRECGTVNPRPRQLPREDGLRGYDIQRAAGPTLTMTSFQTVTIPSVPRSACS